MLRPRLATGAGALLTCVMAAAPVCAQEDAPAEPERRLLNRTELSAVATAGNSETSTIGFTNEFAYRWGRQRLTARLEALRRTKAPDRFVEVELPQDGVGEATLRFRDPDQRLDVERYLIEARFDHFIGKRAFVNVGTSWDRNGEAAIRSRHVYYAGLGHVWHDSDDMFLESFYGLSYTDRREEFPDPSKDEHFAGVRLGYDYRNLLGGATTLRSRASFNGNLQDFQDWTGEMDTSIDVALNARLALQLGVQLSYNNRPALEEVNVIAFVPGGPSIDFGTVTELKERLDVILTSSLVITFGGES